MTNAKLISITSNAEQTISYCARVSNPNNQDNQNISALLNYCIKHKHWSIFEQANMIIEIKTTRAIAPQILRHRSFTFQEFSQRYSKATSYIQARARSQDVTNKILKTIATYQRKNGLLKHKMTFGKLAINCMKKL